VSANRANPHHVVNQAKFSGAGAAAFDQEQRKHEISDREGKRDPFIV